MNYDFIKGKVGALDLKVRRSFSNLPADTNEKIKGLYFRFRRFSKFYKADNEILDNKDTNFFQPKFSNRYAGGKVRKFKKIEPIILKKIQSIIRKNFFIYLEKNKKYEFGIHQLRITCGKDNPGYPVPEGWHKDGYEKIIILNVDSKNISGGTTRLKSKINSDKDDFAFMLNKNEFILVNDKKFFHYTDPINIFNEKTTSYRDTIVITVKSIK
tara:strand:+ start:524 stop:1162 length:639 start_codon:yes stop_codon:yes gene_type:complete